ncbi:MAG: hypothetical protein HKP06_01470 [Flavobacteriaceae bacterium]|nr:hypothetical protein [Flavobacteriaceae bacterium]
MKNNEVIILSDDKGVGKTTALVNWVNGKSNIAGFLSPIVNGKRMFLNVETQAMIPMETEQRDLTIGKYAFDSSSFDQVEKSILKSWQETTAEFLVLDEIGPLEINKGLGFHELLLQLLIPISTKTPKLLLVVRKDCIDAFKSKYKLNTARIMSLHEFKKVFL